MYRPMLFLFLLFTTGLVQAAVIIDDRFNDPRSGWPDVSASSSRDVGFAVYANGKYQMTPVQDRAFGVIRAPRQASSGNVSVASRFFMYAGLGAGGAGVVCRMQDLDNFYAFIVVGSGEWRIARIEKGKVNVLASGSADPQVMPGAVDAVMEARCDGEQLSLSLAGKRVGEARDAVFASGSAGLFVAGEQAAGTSASFEDFRLSAL